MRWLADECVDAGVVDRLCDAGHDVLYVAEMAAGESDVRILERAQTDDRLLLTEDKDFGDLVFRSGQAIPGLVLLRLEPQQAASNGAGLQEQLRISARRCEAGM